MPEIRIKQEIECDINIDVYCGTCGAGLCSQTKVNDRHMSFTVDVCLRCMEKKDQEIESLLNQIEELSRGEDR